MSGWLHESGRMCQEPCNGSHMDAVVPPFLPAHGKGTVYDGGINVPFIVKSPFVAPELVGGATEALVCSTDILATVASIAGLSLPPDPHGTRDTVSFLPVLAGWSATEREFSYAEVFFDNFIPTRDGDPPSDFKPNLHRRAIRNHEGYKLLQRVSRDYGEINITEKFYYLPRDPHEKVNLMARVNAKEEPYARVYAELRAELDAEWPTIVN